MKILVEKFCSISTSPAWQSWLYNFDRNLHSWYIQRMRESTGCDSNRNLMVEALEEVQKRDSSSLIAFLRSNFPQVLLEENHKPQSLDRHGIFPEYSPGILTYPRRTILVGSRGKLNRMLREFLNDKPVHDSVILDDRAYIEYLEVSDMHLKDAIPEESWLIKNHRR